MTKKRETEYNESCGEKRKGNMLMSNEKKKKVFALSGAWSVVVTLVLACGCSIAALQTFDRIVVPSDGLGGFLLNYGVSIGLLFGSMLLQIIIHEAGHLIFGLLSGYRFCSFRIFSFMWLKEEGRIRFKRLSIAGTAGQCLMGPPDLKDGKMPVILYNLGGSLLNLITAAVFGLLAVVLWHHSLMAAVLSCCAWMGVMSALTNGIPMRTGTVDNDGCNALSLSADLQALQMFRLQMKIAEQTTLGLRLKDMPEEWFQIPDSADMENTMVATIAVFGCNRLLDAGKLEEADSRMERLLNMKNGMAGLHRCLLICDRMFVELVGQNRKEVLDAFRTKEVMNVMKQMRDFPSVLRTQYALALLGDQNMEQAQKIKAKFEKIAKTYPYPNDIQSDQELMELADRQCRTL